MGTCDIVVIGGSVGAISPLKHLLGALPATLPMALCIVIPLPLIPTVDMATLFDRFGPLPCVTAEDSEPIQPGRVYVARPGHHLIIEQDYLRVIPGPKDFFSQPAIDLLFCSAAFSYGPRAIGVILSGALTDGVAGLQAVKQAGGITIVQDPNEAAISHLPENALKAVDVDYCLAAADIPPILIYLSKPA